MKFYIVRWYDTAATEGIGYEFFRTKHKALRRLSEVKRDIEAPAECYCPTGRTVKAGEQCPVCLFTHEPRIDLASLEMEAIEFTGTPREIAFKALCYQVV